MPSATTTIPGDVTALLDAWNQGERDALDRLMELVEHELRHIAGCLFQGERREHTLQPTALVHELYLKLTQQRSVSWRGRLEFFAGAAHVMRRILVDHARKHRALKRGGDALRIPFEEALGLPGELAPEMIALDDALIDLERRSPRQCRVVELRVLVGLSIDEIAALLEVSPSTVSREWKTARLFLLRELQSG